MNKIKRKNTKPGVNAVGAGLVSAQDSKGITLVALIITIIVMLILVGVSITIAIRGGLFDITKKAAKETEDAKNAEQALANGRVKIGETWYDSIEDYINDNPSANQEEGGGGTPEEPEPEPPTDLNEGNTTFTYTPNIWTKGPVKVGIATTVEGYTLQYSTDNTTWYNYEKEVEVSTNGEIYARLIDESERVGGVATGNVEKIDKKDPEIITEINTTGQEPESISLSIKAKDEESGFSKIKWYYKKETEGTYTVIEPKADTEMNGTNAGETGEVTKETTIPSLSVGSKYNIYVEIYDVAGNIKRSPETGELKVSTLMAWENGTTGATYATMAEAFSTASSEDTLKLLGSYTDSSEPVLNTKVTIDMNSKTLTKTSKTITIASGGTLYMKNGGTITTSENMNLITNNGKLYLYISNYASPPSGWKGTLANENSLGGYVLYNAGTVSTSEYGQSTITSGYRAIYNDGELKAANSDITATDIAIYITSSGTLSLVSSPSGRQAGTIKSMSNYAVYNSGGTFTWGSYKLYGATSPYYYGSASPTSGFKIVTDTTNGYSYLSK